MTAPRTRSARIAAATAGLGLAALAAAPAALADGYQQVTPTPSASSVPPHTSTAVSAATYRTTGTRVLATKHHAGSLAYTGFEAGGVAAAGLALVVGGTVLVRGGRRRPQTSA